MPIAICCPLQDRRRWRCSYSWMLMRSWSGAQRAEVAGRVRKQLSVGSDDTNDPCLIVDPSPPKTPWRDRPYSVLLRRGIQTVAASDEHRPRIPFDGTRRIYVAPSFRPDEPEVACASEYALRRLCTFSAVRVMQLQRRAILRPPFAGRKGRRDSDQRESADQRIDALRCRGYRVRRRRLVAAIRRKQTTHRRARGRDTASDDEKARR